MALMCTILIENYFNDVISLSSPDESIHIPPKAHGHLLVSDSRVTRATSVPILVFLGLSVLNLCPMYTTDRHQTKASLNASALWGRGIIMGDMFK